MTEEEFVATYCTSARREELFAELKHAMRIVRESMDPVRVVVYGSFVTEKEFPGDIDVLLCGDLRPERWTSEPFQPPSSETVHIKATVRLPGPKPTLPDAESMIAGFNEANRTKDIAVGHWVELELGVTSAGA